MTHQSVEILIGKLVTDEELREAFQQNPHGVLMWLLRQGLQLSRLEIEALKSIKPSDLSGLADMIDRRLQKAALRRAPMTDAVRDTDTLPTAPLGTTGMRITRVGFGAWAIGGGGWTFAWVNQDDADRLAAIRHAARRLLGHTPAAEGGREGPRRRALQSRRRAARSGGAARTRGHAAAAVFRDPPGGRGCGAPVVCRARHRGHRIQSDAVGTPHGHVQRQTRCPVGCG